MLGVGIAWASILVMPYAILAGALPAARMGVYMGIFNFFIVIPEIVASLGLEPVMKEFFGNDPVKVVMLGGAFLLVGAMLMQFVPEAAETSALEPRPGSPLSPTEDATSSQASAA
jgi:maltose/moltooligosaccharide transporter